MNNSRHIHWLRNYDLMTTFGESFCGQKGLHILERDTGYLMFAGFNEGVGKFRATTAFFEVTCEHCARYRLSLSKDGDKKGME